MQRNYLRVLEKHDLYHATLETTSGEIYLLTLEDCKNSFPSWDGNRGYLFKSLNVYEPAAYTTKIVFTQENVEHHKTILDTLFYKHPYFDMPPFNGYSDDTYSFIALENAKILIVKDTRVYVVEQAWEDLGMLVGEDLQDTDEFSTTTSDAPIELLNFITTATATTGLSFTDFSAAIQAGAYTFIDEHLQAAWLLLHPPTATT